MLHLKSTTSERWLQQVTPHLDELLIDHAHCERKAAGTAMSLLSAYIEHDRLCLEMTLIVKEELEHFHLVRGLLTRRGIKFRRIPPSSYGHRLSELVRKQEPGRAIDRLLIAGLIEARSCERFGLLRQHLQDHELAYFFGSLFESEARHHSTYVQLAMSFGHENDVRDRLHELATSEAKILEIGDDFPRMHS
jgi:tRNA 2-(methylsulfanyl)-N6-isopentenyladenosine37 hydroxylase